MNRRLIPLLAFLILGAAAWSSAGRSSHPSQTYAFNKSQILRFVDRWLPSQMARYRVPGVVFVAVRNGKVLASRGFGYANLARHIGINPSRSLFDLGPTSVVFTATAVLQLARQGKVRLNENVNRYLQDFRVPSTYRQPITLAQLLTNTSGLGDTHLDRMTLSAHDVQPLGRYLRSYLPPRLTPPGRQYAYSTLGFTLAGYVVQSASGISFSRYLARNVFRPLDMGHSTFRQPLPSHFPGTRTTGYDIVGKTTSAAPFDYFNVSPGEGVVTTGDDMAHFLIALLGQGRYRGSQALPRTVIREMLAQHFSSYPRLSGFPPMPGVAYGFDREEKQGQLAIEESGAVRGFTSLISLLPARHAGFFIAGNTAHDSYMFRLQSQILRHFFRSRSRPRKPRPYQPPTRSLAAFEGTYWSDEYSPNTIEKLRQLVNQVTVSSAGPAALTARFWTGGKSKLVRIGPRLFQSGSGINATYWAFHVDRRGRVIWMAAGGNTIYDRIPWYEASPVQLEYSAGIILVYLTGLVVWLIVPLLARAGRSFKARDAVLSSAAGSRGLPDWFAAWLAGMVSSLNLLFALGLGLALWSAISTQDQHYSWLEYGIPAWVTALLVLPIMTTLLTAAMVSLTPWIWTKRLWTLPRRLHYTVIMLAGVAFIPFLLFWNLLGFH